MHEAIKHEDPCAKRLANVVRQVQVSRSATGPSFLRVLLDCSKEGTRFAQAHFIFLIHSLSLSSPSPSVPPSLPLPFLFPLALFISHILSCLDRLAIGQNRNLHLRCGISGMFPLGEERTCS